MEKALIPPKAKWIWENVHKQNQWVVFKKRFQTNEHKQEKFVLHISADTRYFLWVNGKTVVMDGGLFRDAYCEKSGFLDAVDISSYIKNGENKLEFLVWHYGNGGRNNNPLPYGGLLFFSQDESIVSDQNTECASHPSFLEKTEGEQPDYLYGGYNIGYDANQKLQDSDFHQAVVYENSLYGELFHRPIPMFRFGEKVYAEYKKNGDIYHLVLPCALHILPWMKIRAKGGERIDIRGDRYLVNGGPGGGGKGQFRGHRTEYICKSGINEYLNMDYFACESIFFRIPESVEVVALGYVLSEYDCDIVKILSTENETVNCLMKKCARTLKFCMRDNFMDCPDRERGQWIGDVSVQAPQVFYALDSKAMPLLKKAIENFICLRKGDRLVGNVPGIHFSELPSQSLNAVGTEGMIAKYYEFTGDVSVLQLAFEPVIRYLKLWEMTKEGKLIPRKGDWYWFDHLYNVDEEILEHTWYYLALKFAEKMSLVLNESRYLNFLRDRMKKIADGFEGWYWKEKYYTSGKMVDDRANAMAVLAGLANPSHYDDIRLLLMENYQCSSYMEGYVEEALFRMGFGMEAYQRMINRYMPLIQNENSTLWEDFAVLGTKNHAWTGAPLTLYYRYVLGIKSDNFYQTIRIQPDFRFQKKYEFELEFDGKRIAVLLKQENGKIESKIHNETTRKVLIIKQI